jgi:hypothetical protein
MTIPELFSRDENAKAAAMRQYSANFDWFAESEQTYRTDLPDLAKEVGAVAFLFLRAYTAEMRDPEPRGKTNIFCCAGCMVYRMLPAESKPPMERIG